MPMTSANKQCFPCVTGPSVFISTVLQGLSISHPAAKVTVSTLDIKAEGRCDRRNSAAADRKLKAALVQAIIFMAVKDMIGSCMPSTANFRM